jgi:hypothetical protein
MEGKKMHTDIFGLPSSRKTARPVDLPPCHEPQVNFCQASHCHFSQYLHLLDHHLWVLTCLCCHRFRWSCSSITFHLSIAFVSRRRCGVLPDGDAYAEEAIAICSPAMVLNSEEHHPVRREVASTGSSIARTRTTQLRTAKCLGQMLVAVNQTKNPDGRRKIQAHDRKGDSTLGPPSTLVSRDCSPPFLGTTTVTFPSSLSGSGLY